MLLDNFLRKPALGNDTVICNVCADAIFIQVQVKEKRLQDTQYRLQARTEMILMPSERRESIEATCPVD